MSTKYLFSQQINYPALLKLSLLAAGISVTLQDIETDALPEGMVVTIAYADALDEPDLGKLNAVMASYADPTNTAQMVTDITAALQDDAKLMKVLRTRTITLIQVATYGELKGVCALLGITS